MHEYAKWYFDWGWMVLMVVAVIVGANAPPRFAFFTAGLLLVAGLTALCFV